MIRMALDEYMNPVHSPYRMIASLPQQLKAVAFAFLATQHEVAAAGQCTAAQASAERLHVQQRV